MLRRTHSTLIVVALGVTCLSVTAPGEAAGRVIVPRAVGAASEVSAAASPVGPAIIGFEADSSIGVMDVPEPFTEVAARFLGREPDRLERVRIEPEGEEAKA